MAGVREQWSDTEARVAYGVKHALAGTEASALGALGGGARGGGEVRVAWAVELRSGVGVHAVRRGVG